MLWLACCLLAACGGQQVTRLRIGMNPWPGYAHLAIAVKSGHLAAQGIDAHLVEYPTLHDLARGFADGQIDVIPSTLVEVLTLRNSGGRRLEVVWIADQSCGGDVLVSRHKTADELRGRRIAYEAHTLGNYILSRFLALNALTAKDVEAVSMSQDQMCLAMAEGRIDGAITYPPFSARMLATPGATTVFDTRAMPDEVIDTISIDTKLLDQDPTLLARLHTAMVAAHRHCIQEPAEARRIMARACGMTEREFVEASNGIQVYGPESQAAWLQDATRLQSLAERIASTVELAVPVGELTCAAKRGSPLLTQAVPR